MNYPIEIGIPTIFDSLFLFPIFSTIELSFRFRVERSTETFRDEISRFVTFVTLVALSVTTPFDPFFPTFIFRLVATANQLAPTLVVPPTLATFDVAYFIDWGW